MSLNLIMALKALVILGGIAAFALNEIRLAKRDRRDEESESDGAASD